MAIGICGSLNAVLFRPTCTEQFTKTAINIVCSIPPDERAVFIKSLVRSLANGEEQKRGAELLVMLGTRIPEFWPIWKFIKHAIADDRSYPHVKTVLAGIVKGRNRKEDAEFMKKASENIGELIWAVDECISRRGQEMYIEITFNSTFGVECLANLMELAQKRGYNQRCKDAIKEITMGSRETFHAARECAKRFEPDKDTPANDALISITAQVLEGPHWRAATSGIEYRLGKNDPEKRWRAVAFAEKVIRTLEQRNQTTCLASSEASVSNPQFVNQQITNKTAELVITRMAVAISFKRRPGVRELFDKMLEGGGNIADTAMHSIAMELFGFLGPCKRDVMDGIAEYVGAKPELEGLITEHMIKLARGDEEVRKKMRGFISGENATIRRIATIVHNISNTKTASMGRKHMDSGRGSGLDRRNGARMPA